MMIMIATKDYKTIDGRIIKCDITKDFIIMSCRGLSAKYKHTEVNQMLDLHNKILSDKTLKEIQKFINESREPEQLSLF